LYSVTAPHNIGRVFSTTAPGILLGVGNIGRYLKPYDECDTFMSTDAGVTWTMIKSGAHKYEVGDQGSIIVVVNDEEATDTVEYSTDYGKTWCVSPYFQLECHLYVANFSRTIGKNMPSIRKSELAS
jgi:hypothetical protein